MPVSGKIKRGSTGRLARDSSGRLRRCSCCIQGAGCIYVIKAVPCNQVLGPTCDRQIPEFIWICTNRVCDDEPIGVDVRKCFALEFNPSLGFPEGVFCYCTVPGTQILRSAVPPEEEQFVLDGICVDNCSHPLCDPGTPDTCPCVCYDWTTSGDPPVQDPDTFCCMGKKDEDGNLCWDWRYTAYQEVRREFAPVNGGIQERCNSNDTFECVNAGGCVTFRREWRHKDPNPYDQCIDSCCKEKELETREVIRKQRNYPVDDCAIFPGFCAGFGGVGLCDCCACPNLADGVWGPGPGGPQVKAVCTPLNKGTTTTITEVLPPTDVGGCTSKIILTVTVTETCDYREVTSVEELWEPYTEFSPNCPDQPNSCCVCLVKSTITNYERIDWVRPHAGDPECFQCQKFLATPP